jgi:hypothetical protein
MHAVSARRRKAVPTWISNRTELQAGLRWTAAGPPACPIAVVLAADIVLVLALVLVKERISARLGKVAPGLIHLAVIACHL